MSDCLDIFTIIGDACDRGLIDKDVIYVWHGYSIARAFDSEGIKKFIAEERKEDPEFYEGFESLAAEMIDEERKSGSKGRDDKRLTK